MKSLMAFPPSRNFAGVRLMLRHLHKRSPPPPVKGGPARSKNSRSTETRSRPLPIGPARSLREWTLSEPLGNTYLERDRAAPRDSEREGSDRFRRPMLYPTELQARAGIL